jgi:CRP/FNR family transcriptional regulator, cyclic AMP receptor protein
MDAHLRQGELFEGLSDECLRRLLATGKSRTLQAGEYLFLLGDDASDFSVLVSGKVDLCFPMRIRGAVKDVTVESVGAGQALGWSALVKPHRFTLSARAIEPSEVVRFARGDLLELFEAEPSIGYAFFTKVSEVVGLRLHTFQALWVRELQRALESDAQRLAERTPPSP